MTMTVRIAHPVTIDGALFATGQEITVSDPLGRKLVAAGYASDLAYTPPGPNAPLDIVTADEVAGLVAAAMTLYSPGAVQDYSERSEDWSTTNASATSTAASSIIDGLELSVVGTGRPVELTFFAGSVRHSSANQFVSAYLLNSVGGSPWSIVPTRFAAVQSVSTTVGRTLQAIWDFDTVEGEDYVFAVGIWGGVAGTSTLQADFPPNGAYPITFKARNH